MSETAAKAHTPGKQPTISASHAHGSAWDAQRGVFAPVERMLPEEVAVAIMAGRRPAAVLIASPGDYADLAWGFALTEGLAARPADIGGCRIDIEASGVRAVLDLREQKGMARERTLPGRSSCGLCGVSDLKHAIRVIPRVPDGGAISPGALQAGFAALESHQPLNAQTRAVHAAAHIRADGVLTVVREDVGRHNALDKLIGALARAGIDPGAGAVLLTSRASYEMVDKAAMAGVRVLAAISAPSALALRKAEGAGMTLVAVARRDGFVAFTGGERLGLEGQEP